MRLPPLNAVRAFAVVAQYLSFKKAAEELFVTPAAVTYQVKLLEEFLGLELFIRHNRSITLSPAGRQCIADVEAGFDLIARGMQKASQESRQGRLIVTAGPAFTIKWLAPGLRDFSISHPEINASVSASLHLIDLRDDDADVAIRFGYPPKEDYLYSEVLAQERVVPMCHPDLAATLEKPLDLLHHSLIHDDSLSFDREAHGWGRWLREVGVNEGSIDGGIHFNQADHALQAAIDGNGVVMGRRVLAAPDIEAGRLAVVFPELEQDTGLKHYFVCLRSRLKQEKINAFREWIIERMQHSCITT